MKTAVIIPVRDRSESLYRAVTSVIEQTSPVSAIVVVDDGSETDKPTDVLSDIQDERLKILHQPQLGVSAARNLGIKSTETEWVALLDSDDYWLPEKMEKQLSYHAKNPDYRISQTEETWIRNGSQLNPRGYHRKREGDIFEVSLERCLISPSAVMMHRSLLDDVGLFDPTLPACEDYDLWLRVTPRYEVGLIPEKLVVKTGGHPDQLSRKYWGMDRFRVHSLCKILDEKILTQKQHWTAVQVLATKLNILEAGARKRGKRAEAKAYRELREKYTDPIPENLTLFPATDGV